MEKRKMKLVKGLTAIDILCTDCNPVEMNIKKKKLNSPSDISLSLISHANIVGFSRLYCSIFETTAGVATFGFEPPIRPGGRSVPEIKETLLITKYLLCIGNIVRVCAVKVNSYLKCFF